MINVLFSILFTISSLVQDYTIKDQINDSLRFEGTVVRVSEDTMYKGILYDKAFHMYKGYFDKEYNPFHYREEFGVFGEHNDTNYGNLVVNESEWEVSHYLYEKNSEKEYNRNHDIIGLKPLRFEKKYSAKRGRWDIVWKIEFDKNHKCQCSTKYDKKGYFYNAEKMETEPIVYTVGYFCIVFGGVFLFLWPFHRFWPDVFSPLVLAIISLLFSILFFICFSRYEREQIINIIVAFSILFFCINPIKSRVVRNCLQFFICTALFSFTCIFCFVHTSGVLKLGDESKISVSWAPGTDFIKRVYIKEMFHDFMPVPIKNDKNQYTLYMNRLEFSEADFGIITDDLFSLLGVLFNKEPLVEISYRECQLLIEKLNKITGVVFDMPTVNEWECATNGTNYYRSSSKLDPVSVGISNKYGLVHIVSNAAEYASNYYPDVKILSLDADTLINSYDFVAFCVGDSIGNHRKCYVDKNSNESTYLGIPITFRLVYRPNNIGRRHFNIKGRLRSDKNNDTLPKDILLISLNGEKVRQLPNYETFQERLIESRYGKKTIEAIDLSTQENISLSFPEGIEFYDFVPEFWFEGL